MARLLPFLSLMALLCCMNECNHTKCILLITFLTMFLQPTLRLQRSQCSPANHERFAPSCQNRGAGVGASCRVSKIRSTAKNQTPCTTRLPCLSAPAPTTLHRLDVTADACSPYALHPSKESVTATCLFRASRPLAAAPPTQVRWYERSVQPAVPRLVRQHCVHLHRA